ncbi:hypothetical protein [uncultured Psychroserpens sp.]|uniref:hypothetical protein n=1 Tax=uncultured Psychroserpens sp. TaxID=255436 RepID=UPI00261C4942|nr:hypothetical protein [uncultured Psychroserpens sp.]
MKKERLSLKTSLMIGFINGVIFASFMAVFDYFDDSSFSLLKFAVNFLFFGAVMAMLFRYKYTKE